MRYDEKKKLEERLLREREEGKRLIDDVNSYKKKQYEFGVTHGSMAQRDGKVLCCLKELLEHEYTRHQFRFQGNVYCTNKLHECPLQYPNLSERKDTSEKPKCLGDQWLRALYRNKDD